MTSTLYEALERMSVIREGLVVRNVDGTAKTDDQANKAMGPVCRRAGLPVRLLHTLRRWHDYRRRRIGVDEASEFAIVAVLNHRGDHLNLIRDRLLSQEVHVIRGDLGIGHYRRLFESALAGDGAAAAEIAQAYYGNRLQPSSEQAYYRWVAEAARLGHEESLIDLARVKMFGTGVRRNYRAAWAHLETALLSADDEVRVSARVLMAAGYLHGWGRPINTRLALRALESEAAAGSVAAAEILGETFVEGSVARRNFRKAATWLKVAALAGTPSCARRLAELYEFGRGVHRSPETAMYWMKRAAVQGDLEARHLLGLYYQDGVGTRASRAMAIRWYLRSWEFKNPSSAFNLALIYWCSGRGSRRMAWHWFRRAAKYGHSISRRFIECRDERLINPYLPDALFRSTKDPKP